MMEKELVQLFEKVKKAADAAADSTAEEERCLDALQKLMAFPVTYEVLVSTQIGKRLRRLTKHPREKIQSLASDVVAKWRRVILKGTARLHQKRLHQKRIHQKLVSANDEDKKKKVQRLSCVRVPGKMAVESVQAPPDLGSWRLTNDRNRDKIRSLLAKAMSKVPHETYDMTLRTEIQSKYDPCVVAAEVESAMFSSCGSFKCAQGKYRSLMFNIGDAKNPDFRRKVLLGVYRPDSVTQMAPEQMASDERRLENEAIKKRALSNCENSLKLEATTDGFKCERCNKRETTYNEVQTRGADEPLTVYITCVSCGHRWNTLGT